MLRIVEYYFLYSSNLKCFSREKKPKTTKKQNKTKNTKKYLSSSDPDHVVKRKGEVLIRQDKRRPIIFELIKAISVVIIIYNLCGLVPAILSVIQLIV